MKDLVWFHAKVDMLIRFVVQCHDACREYARRRNVETLGQEYQRKRIRDQSLRMASASYNRFLLNIFVRLLRWFMVQLSIQAHSAQGTWYDNDVSRPRSFHNVDRLLVLFIGCSRIWEQSPSCIVIFRTNEISENSIPVPHCLYRVRMGACPSKLHWLSCIRSFWLVVTQDPDLEAQKNEEWFPSMWPRNKCKVHSRSHALGKC